MKKNSSAYKKISDYGIIGNLHSAALVGSDGSIDWLCLPHLDSPSIFGALLDARNGGRFAVKPKGAWKSIASYIPGTNVMETRFRTESGILKVTDFMPVCAEHEIISDDQHSLFRLLETEEGHVTFETFFEPRFDYARARTTLTKRSNGISAEGGGRRLSFSATVPMQVENEIGYAQGTLSAGEMACLHLRFARQEPEPVDLDESRGLLADTIRFWRKWLRRSEKETQVDFGRYREQAERSLLVLKLLFYGPTGSLAAAATTSLPEEIGGVRNWDYRYCWIRDAAMTAEVFSKMGHRRELEDYLRWIGTVIARHPEDHLDILYRLDGEAPPPETELDHLEGYKGSQPVRIGNAARGQKQLGIYGHLLAGAERLSGTGEPFPENLWPHLSRYCDFVLNHWREEDLSIWEMRGEPNHYVHSKLMCWVALDRGIELSRRHGFPADIEKWESTKEEIRQEILKRGWSESRQSFVLAYDGDELDASNLLIPILGFLPFDDDRVLATTEAIRQDLGIDSLLYRYRGNDGLPGGEGAFLLCTCWLIVNLACRGKLQEAESVLQRLWQTSSPLGIFSEEYDPHRNLQLGNFPQAFTHLGFLEAVYAVQKSKEAMGGKD